MPNFEEKLIRYITSKLLQRKYLAKKRTVISNKLLSKYIDVVLAEIKKEYKQYNLVRRHSEEGILTPLIKPIVDKIKM